MSLVKVLCAGDYLIGMFYLMACNKEDGWDFDTPLKEVSPLIKEADVSILNLETSYGGGLNKSDYLEVDDFDGKPTFNTPDEAISAAAKAGFNCFLTASNHTYDCGHEGLIRKQKVLRQNNLQYVGTKLKKREPDYLILEKNGIRIGLLNYTRESVPAVYNPREKRINSHLIEKRDWGLICSFNNKNIEDHLSRVRRNIRLMRREGVDFILYFPHWGKEFDDYPKKREQAIARKIANMGVDAIVGGHPHVIQPYELIVTSEGREVPCLYSPGNFVSYSKRNPAIETREGVLFELTFRKENGEKSIKTDYIPIFTDCNDQRGDFVVIPLNDLEHYKGKRHASIADLTESKKRIDSAFLRMSRFTIASDLSLLDICGIVGAELPDKLKKIKDRRNLSIVCSPVKKVTQGSVWFNLFENNKNIKEQLDEVMLKKPLVVFVNKKQFESSGLNEQDYPVILLENVYEQSKKLFDLARNRFKGVIVTATGSIGKTTTLGMCRSVLSEQFEVLGHKMNENSWFRMGQNMLKYMTAEQGDLSQVYVQEIGGSRPGSINKAARVLNPDIFILTNIKEHGLNKYKTMEALKKDKFSIDDHLTDNGVVIANWDDPIIRAHSFKHKVITYGVESTDCDFRAENIVQNGAVLECDIISNGISNHIKVHIVGKHNAYCVLAAYVLGSVMNMTPEVIYKGLDSFRTNSKRQNYFVYKGIHLMVDCHNVAEDSILALLDSQMAMEVPGRKIAILGAENSLGGDIYNKTVELGHKIGQYQLDEIVFFGSKNDDEESLQRFGDARTLMKAFQEVNKSTPVRLITDLNELSVYIRKNVKEGDSLFVKAITWLNTVDAIKKGFGPEIDRYLSK